MKLPVLANFYQNGVFNCPKDWEILVGQDLMQEDSTCLVIKNLATQHFFLYNFGTCFWSSIESAYFLTKERWKYEKNKNGQKIKDKNGKCKIIQWQEKELFLGRVLKEGVYFEPYEHRINKSYSHKISNYNLDISPICAGFFGHPSSQLWLQNN